MCIIQDILYIQWSQIWKAYRAHSFWYCHGNCTFPNMQQLKFPEIWENNSCNLDLLPAQFVKHMRFVEHVQTMHYDFSVLHSSRFHLLGTSHLTKWLLQEVTCFWDAFKEKETFGGQQSSVTQSIPHWAKALGYFCEQFWSPLYLSLLTHCKAQCPRTPFPLHPQWQAALHMWICVLSFQW